MAIPFQVTFDCSDPDKLAHFWAEALGYIMQPPPEGKTAKNRVHLDVNVGGGRAVPDAERRPRVDAKADALVEAGATELRRLEENGEYFIAMLDPEGNEFDLQ